MISSRRSFMTSLGAALITAPAIVRVSSIMPVKQMAPSISIDEFAALLQVRLDAAQNELARQLAQSLYAHGQTDMELKLLSARLEQKPYWELREIVEPAAVYMREKPRQVWDDTANRWRLA